MAIFIGRKLEEASRKWLLQQEVAFSEEPMIEVQLLDVDASVFSKIVLLDKSWIVTSKHAALWLLAHHAEIGFRSADTVFCISDKQAAILIRITQSIVIAGEKNSESLVQEVKSQKQTSVSVYLRGNRSLQLKGLDPFDVEVYHTSLLKPKVEGSFSSYLFFSSSGVESFVEGNNQISEQAKIIVIGETTAQYARNAFANEVITSANASEIEMLEMACQKVEVKGYPSA